MARIASSELERIKQDISLVRLVEMEGFKLRRQGRDFVLLCPFHQEKRHHWWSVRIKTCSTALVVVNRAR